MYVLEVQPIFPVVTFVTSLLTIQDLECPKFVPHFLLHDCLRYLLPCRVGAAVKAAQEDEQSPSNLII